MTRATNALTGQNKPDGTLTLQKGYQTFIMQVYFNHDSKETFQDKLLRVMLTDLQTAPKQYPSIVQRPPSIV